MRLILTIKCAIIDENCEKGCAACLKKIGCLLLCAILVFGMLPFGVAAEDEDIESFSLRDTVIEQARTSYYHSRASAGKVSFHGKCGLLVGHQLYNLGINKKCIVFDGNDNFDHYASIKRTTGGYYINAYSSGEYDLYGALMAVTDNGTRDVQNILVGFQWTNTEAGGKYGHAMFINGIVGGTVYFVESFDCSLGGPEGTVLSCSIKEFARYYNRWTIFDGIVHFGSGTYYDICPNVSTDLTVQTRFPTTLRSEPAVVGKQGCVRLRSIAAGERLHVTAIYRAERTMYYRVETNEGFGFVNAAAVSLLQLNTQDLTLSDVVLPQQMQTGQTPNLEGWVADARGTLISLEICITDSQGQLVRREIQRVEDSTASLGALRDALWLNLLELGVYQLDIYASRECAVVVGSDTGSEYARIWLTGQKLQVGGDPRGILQSTKRETTVTDGWFLNQGTWYCYAEGKPATGWVHDLGVRYYLQADGSVTTGEQVIDGQSVYFSVTGALITGWQTLEGKTYYRSADGCVVTGWQTLEGKLYCFGEDGVMLTNTEQTKDGIPYIIAKDGTAKIIEKQETKNG